MSTNEAAERPWFAQGPLIHGPDKGGIDIGPLIGEMQSDTDAEYVVRVVNAHERSAGATPLDVEVLTVILWEAENDDQLGVEYEPRRLAEYILAALASERTDR